MNFIKSGFDLKWSGFIYEVLRSFNFYRSLNKKLREIVLLEYFTSITLFLFNQLFLVLSFFLPLKVILMLGTPGIPSYMRFFIEEGSKSTYVTIFASLAFLFYMLFLATESLISTLASSASGKILSKAKKVILFDNQEQFSKDIFVRLVRSYGTLILVISGFLLILFLEWRVFINLTSALLIEFYFFNNFWKYIHRVEKIKKRDNVIKNRQVILNSISAINFFVGFLSVFYFFHIGKIDSFLIGVLFVLVLRQIFQRLTVLITDAIFLMTNFEKIRGIYYTNSTYIRDENHQAEVFIKSIAPDRRNDLFLRISKYFKNFDSGNWTWNDTSEKQVAIYSNSRIDNSNCYWIKFYASHKEGVYQREKLVIEALNKESQPFVPSILYNGKAANFYYLVLSTKKFSTLDVRSRKRMIIRWQVDTWCVKPPVEISKVLGRSFPSIDKRLKKLRLEDIKVACNNNDEIELVDRLLVIKEEMIVFLVSMPKFINNKDLSPLNTICTGEGEFTLINWAKVSVEPIASDARFDELGFALKPKEILAKLKEKRNDCLDLSENDIFKSIYLSALVQFLDKKQYRAAYDLVPQLVKCFND